MTEKAIKIIEEGINLALDYIGMTSVNNSNGNPISYNTRRELNEILETLYVLSKTEILQPPDDVITRRIFNIGEYVVHEKLLHFGNYHYAKQILIDSDIFKREEILRRTNVESASMLIRIRSYQLGINGIGGSTDDYFIERMPQLLTGISYVLNYNLTEIYLPVAYNLLNLHQTVFNYYRSKHTTYIPALDSLRKRIVAIINKAFQNKHIIKFCKTNILLKFFHEQYLFYESFLTKSKYVPSFDTDIDLEQLNLQQKLRILYSLSMLNREAFLKRYPCITAEIESDQIADKTTQALAVRVSAIYLRFVSKESIELNINLKVNHIDFSKYLPRYFNRINEISEIPLTEEELKLLHSYNDSDLRSRVGKCMVNIPANEIEREMRKPHGGFEIADMELRTRIDGKLVYLCMPFKTGKEIKSDSVSIDVLYQVLRPFFHFDHCVVVFITAKSCSQNLLNEIKHAQGKYNFSIEVIENQQLARLLKINDQLN